MGNNTGTATLDRPPIVELDTTNEARESTPEQQAQWVVAKIKELFVRYSDRCVQERVVVGSVMYDRDVIATRTPDGKEISQVFAVNRTFGPNYDRVEPTIYTATLYSQDHQDTIAVDPASGQIRVQRRMRSESPIQGEASWGEPFILSRAEASNIIKDMQLRDIAAEGEYDRRDDEARGEADQSAQRMLHELGIVAFGTHGRIDGE